MKILSINVGLPREVLSGKDIVTTGIFKEPVEGPVKLRKLNIDGDKQADLTVHGGEDKAVYAYPNIHIEQHLDYSDTKSFLKKACSDGELREDSKVCKNIERLERAINFSCFSFLTNILMIY